MYQNLISLIVLMIDLVSVQESSEVNIKTVTSFK
jgi:hypothetical protein